MRLIEKSWPRKSESSPSRVSSAAPRHAVSALHGPASNQHGHAHADGTHWLSRASTPGRTGRARKRRRAGRRPSAAAPAPVASCERPVPKVGDLAVEGLGHLADLGLAQPGGPAGLELLHPAHGNTGHVAGGHHGGQRPLRPPPALQQPVGELRPRPRRRDLHLQGARPTVELAGSVAVAHVGPGLAALAVLAADRVGPSRHGRVDGVVSICRSRSGWPGPTARAGSRHGRCCWERPSRRTPEGLREIIQKITRWPPLRSST